MKNIGTEIFEEMLDKKATVKQRLYQSIIELGLHHNEPLCGFVGGRKPWVLFLVGTLIIRILYSKSFHTLKMGIEWEMGGGSCLGKPISLQSSRSCQPVINYHRIYFGEVQNFLVRFTKVTWNVFFEGAFF